MHILPVFGPCYLRNAESMRVSACRIATGLLASSLFLGYNEREIDPVSIPRREAFRLRGIYRRHPQDAGWHTGTRFAERRRSRKDVTLGAMNITQLERPYAPERYLLDFDTDVLPHEAYDAVIIGSGIAGVYTALSMSRSARVLIITKEAIDMNNSVLAQGGIAVSLDKEDSADLHFRDTAYAGAGLCDEDAVRTLVNEAADNIAQLCLYGVNFDRGLDKQLSLTREAAHSRNRIIHTGDATGKEVCDTLVSAVRGLDNVVIREETFAVDLLTVGNVCRGVLAMDEKGALQVYTAPVVICASGGYGRLYANTTNPVVATGDGAAMAYRAGVHLMDLEFVQFHPTALFHHIEKNFLISEAVRGEGAVLRNLAGERFMPGYHDLAELAPRDIVSRAIFAEMKKTGTDHVLLDITAKDRKYLEHRFPTIFAKCLSFGIDISKDYIPVAPSQHYSMGGIRTDEWGRTGLEGFYAVGEAACNGIHGANRLASNSLLEGLVFGRRIARAINEQLAAMSVLADQPVHIVFKTPRRDIVLDPAAEVAILQNRMTREVGIIRSAEGLQAAVSGIDAQFAVQEGMRCGDIAEMELRNMTLLSGLVARAAMTRTESRGAHYRSDFPNTEEAWHKNLVI